MTNSTKLTGLWKKQDKQGKDYFTGSLTGSARLVIFPNGFKNKETDPDYIAYIVPAEKRNEFGSSTRDDRGSDWGEEREESPAAPQVTPVKRSKSA